MTRRLPIVLLISLALVALVVADRASSDRRVEAGASIESLMPHGSPPEAVSSAFFCAGGAATPGATWGAVLVAANPADTPATIVVTSYPAAITGDADGAAVVANLRPATKAVTIGPRSRVEVNYADVQVSPFAALVVETNDPDIAVERRTVSSTGTMPNASPCSSAASGEWFVPTGSTTRDARELLAVFNPFPVDAVVDITFQTNDGFRNPQELQGLPVPGGQLRVIDISAAVPRLEQLAGTIRARSGRVVVDRLQSFDGSEPTHPAGLAVIAGAPATSQVWTFGDGQVSEGLSETYTLQNPSDTTISAQVEIINDDPGTNGVVDPLPVDVPARGYVQVVMRDQTRVLPNVAHSVVVRTQDPRGLVVERVLMGAAPSSRRGYAPSLGATLVATDWVLADGSAVTGQNDEVVVVVNPSAEHTVRVDVTALAKGQALAVDGLQGIEVAPGARVAIQLGGRVNRPDLPLLVVADRPVSVERTVFSLDGAGFALSAGVPLSETVVLPPLRSAATTTTTISN